MKYQVWIVSRHRKTLHVMAAFKIFEDAIRLHAETALEHAWKSRADMLQFLREQYPLAIVSTQMVMPGQTLPLG